jgi:hypothetical protein
VKSAPGNEEGHYQQNTDNFLFGHFHQDAFHVYIMLAQTTLALFSIVDHAVCFLRTTDNFSNFYAPSVKPTQHPNRSPTKQPTQPTTSQNVDSISLEELG